VTSTYTRFRPPHLVAEYIGQPGNELGGNLLTQAAIDAHALSKSTRGPCEIVVIGRWDYEDGRVRLDYGVPTGYIETVSDWRYDEDAKRLRIVCPECGTKDGKHMKSCDR
jgi:hypothetical protein